MPAVSVILPTRLRNHLLPRALRSLLAQTFRDFEILVVDDNPPERRIRRDAGLADLLRDARVRVLEHDQPRNASAARNVGLRAARGEWITYLDDDDAYQPAKLEKQLQRAQQTGIPVGLCGVTFHLKHRQRVVMNPLDEPGGDELLLAFRALPAVFHRRSDAVFFDEELAAGEDAHLFFHLLREHQLRRVFNVREALVDVYPQPGPRVNANAAAHWQAALRIHDEFGADYGPLMPQVLLVRARLGYWKWTPGGLADMVRLAWRLMALRGLKDTRYILNAFLFKCPALRRFLVG